MPRLYLEDGVDEDPGLLLPEEGPVPPDHLEEGGDEAGAGVQLDVRGEDEVGADGLPGHVPGHVDGVVELHPLPVGLSGAGQALGLLAVRAAGQKGLPFGHLGQGGVQGARCRVFQGARCKVQRVPRCKVYLCRSVGEVKEDMEGGELADQRAVAAVPAVSKGAKLQCSLEIQA